MKLIINPKSFVSEFVNPVNEINREGRIAIFVDDDNIYSISSTKTDSIRLFNTYKPYGIENAENKVCLNILRLVKGLMCINEDQTSIELDIDEKNKNCSFDSVDIKFNVKLLDERMVSIPKFNVKAFKEFPFEYNIEVDQDAMSNIKRGLEFSSETGKFYIEQENDVVFFFFGDKNSTSDHTDSIRVKIADNISDTIPNKIYDIDILKLILKHKNDFSIKLNTKGVMFIEIQNNNSTLKYITTPLIK
jgi:hypothetical protein